MIQQLSEQLTALLFITIGMLITPILFIALDFWAGIRKARKRGVPIRSDKMKRTIDKISRYYNAILAMMVLDAIQIAGFMFLWRFNGWSLYTFPLFTLLSVLYVAAVEIKSIYEPADEKEQRDMHEVAELAKELLKHKDNAQEIADVLAKYLGKTNNEKKEKE